jgi:PAS domain S-box-containing protein
MCWDICAEGMQKRIDSAKELKALQEIKKRNGWDKPSDFIDNSLVWENKVIIVTDTQFTIIYATENMFGMNGYKPSEVIGKSPKMFQGAETEAESRKLIRLAIEQTQEFETVITNYRKDGQRYKCHIEAFPIFNSNGKLVNFVALENAA